MRTLSSPTHEMRVGQRRQALPGMARAHRIIVLVLAMLALDLGVVHRKAHEIKLREALGWTAVWIGLPQGQPAPA